MKKSLLLLATLLISVSLKAQTFPPGPYGSDTSGSGGGGGATPGGNNGDIQFNNSNTFGGTDNLFWDNTNKRVGVNTSTPDNTVQISTSTSNTGLHVGPAFIGSAYSGGGCPGCQADALVSPANSDPVGNEVYAIYMANGGPNIFNTPAGTGMQFRIGGSDVSYYFDVSGKGGLGINTNGPLVSNGVLNVSNGNGAIEWDQANGTSEFFVKNSSGTGNAASLIAVEGNNLLGQQTEGWFFLPNGSYGTTGTHASNTVELYAHNGAALRLATQENNAIDFWTTANQRGIMTGSGQFGWGTNNPAASTILDVSTTTRGSRPAPSMTTTQRNAISSPATGLLIYNTTTTEYEFYNGTGWAAVGAGTSTPGGANTNIQYNNGTTTFTGDANLEWDYTDQRLNINNSGGTPARTIEMRGFNAGDGVSWPILRMAGQTETANARFADIEFSSTGTPGHTALEISSEEDGSGNVVGQFFQDGRSMAGTPLTYDIFYNTTGGSTIQSTLYSSIAKSYIHSTAVGINTTTPASGLEVNDVSKFDNNVTVSGTSYVQLGADTQANLTSKTPTAVGQHWYCSDCTVSAVCISTGTALGQVSDISNRTTTCH